MVIVTTPTNRRPRMASVAQPKSSYKNHPALGQLKKQEIESICRRLEHHHRDSILSPARTVACFAWQILIGNVSCDAVRHYQNGTFSASAYCQSRQRLPLAVLEELSRQIMEQ